MNPVESIAPSRPDPASAETPRRKRRSSPHVIAITSGKGGVGKTNLAANLAWQLRQMRRRVMIMDADLGLANIDILLGLNPEFNISHVLAGRKRLSEILVKGPGGVKVLPASSGLIEVGDLTDAQKLTLLEQLEELEDAFDYLLIDTSAGISSNVVYFALAAQTILVVLTPEPTSLADAYAVIKVLSTTYRQNAFKVVLNEVSGEDEALGVFKKLTTVTDRFLNVSLDYLGFMPRDARVRESVRAQRAFAEAHPDSPAALAVKRLAKRILSLESDPLQSDLGLLWRNILIERAA
jgi:flagellar biosynthesis protein FlhG